MKKYIKTIIKNLLIIILFVCGILLIGKKNSTIKNIKENVNLTEKPRLEDDFYNYINYEELSKEKINQNKYFDSWDSLMSFQEKLDENKKEIINDIISKCSTYTQNSSKAKLCKVYDKYKNIDYDSNKKELKKYIDLINSSQTVDEYLKNISITTNNFPNANILFTYSLNIEGNDYTKVYPSISKFTYDYDTESDKYNKINMSDYSEMRGKLKNTNMELLKLYGYSENEAREMIARTYTMYELISKFSHTPDEFKKININELSKYNNINIEYIKDNLNSIIGVNDNIIIEDEVQLKEIDKYLVKENLQTLKDYATIRLLFAYSDRLGENEAKILHNLDNYFNNLDKEYDFEETIYDDLYHIFKDTITIEYVNQKHINNAKTYYTKLTKEFLEMYKVKLEENDWLSEETKVNAIKKINNMNIYIMYPEQLEALDSNYNVDGSTFMEIDKNINISMLKTQYNLLRKNEEIRFLNDWLEINAFYSPTENCIVIGTGIIESINNYLNISYDKLDENYYKTIGSLGYVIGHEISHAFDNYGSKYDENGKEVDWWTSEDKLAYTKRTLRVEKYYEKYKQEGYQTLGENIADLGSYSLLMDLAKKHNATNDEYKTIFESSAKIWAQQSTKFFKGYMLIYDEHSPSKNRINAVLSSIDKFYEVYNIKETDKMYVSKEDRVAVW